MDNVITLTLADGTTKDFDIILEFYKDKKRFVSYTDYEKDADGNLKCYSSILEDGKTIPIQDPKELEMIDKLLKTISYAEHTNLQKKEE